jgi:hypothetical protein
VEQNLMPAAESNGFVKTLNNMGYMTSTRDPFSNKFISFSSKAKRPVLEIGAAYGIASIPAIELGATVIANDIDSRHLDILKARVEPEMHSRLRLVPGSFPEELDFEPESLDGVLIARVLHFFTGERIESSAKKLHTWLARRGKVFVVAETPYLRNFQSFIPLYEKRVKEGHFWPGFIDDVMQVAPERGQFLPKQMHFLDPNVLTRIFGSNGFDIEACYTISRHDFPEDIQLDGRESVGIVAVKK